MKSGALNLGVAALLTFGSAGVSKADVAPSDVSFEDGAVTASLSGQDGDAEAGAQVVASKSMGNCVACHAVTALSDTPWHGEVGPTLDGAGDRWSEAELRGIVANAKMTFDGTVMPAFYKTEGFIRVGDAYSGKAASGPVPPILTAQQIEDVVAFLSTLKE